MLFDQESVDTKQRMENSRYLYGWDAVKEHIYTTGLVPVGHINTIYEDFDPIVGQGFEDACNHYINGNIDTPDGLTWEI